MYKSTTNTLRPLILPTLTSIFWLKLNSNFIAILIKEAVKYLKFYCVFTEDEKGHWEKNVILRGKKKWKKTLASPTDASLKIST